MTVQKLISSVSAKMPSTLANQDYVDFINELEASVYVDTVKEFDISIYRLWLTQHQYNFPTDTTTR